MDVYTTYSDIRITGLDNSFNNSVSYFGPTANLPWNICDQIVLTGADYFPSVINITSDEVLNPVNIACLEAAILKGNILTIKYNFPTAYGFISSQKGTARLVDMNGTTYMTVECPYNQREISVSLPTIPIGTYNVILGEKSGRRVGSARVIS